MSRRQKVGRAETVLTMLGLKDCADLPVGGALLKGISGGEKRRLSLAVQSELKYLWGEADADKGCSDK
jgi:ABC-type multidrug transport system ATPase subunit